MNDLLYNPLSKGQKFEKTDEKPTVNGLEEFIYFVEENESLVDIAEKFLVTCETLIDDNDISSEPPTGYALLVRLPGKAKILLPEDLAEGETPDPYGDVYPFKIIKK